MATHITPTSAHAALDTLERDLAPATEGLGPCSAGLIGEERRQGSRPSPYVSIPATFVTPRPPRLPKYGAPKEKMPPSEATSQ